MVGIYNETPPEQQYFTRKESKVALDELFSNYKIKLGEGLGVDPKDVKLPDTWYYETMKPIAHISGTAPPDLRETLDRAPFSTVIYKGLVGTERNNAGLIVPKYEYFGEGTPKWQSYMDGKKSMTKVLNNWMPQGLNEKNQREFSGSLVDLHGNVFEFDNKTMEHINDIMYQWESGIQDRGKFGIDTLNMLKGKSSPNKGETIRFALDENGKEITGSPYFIEDTWMGNVLIFNKNRSHFKLQPNALAVPTEYAIKTGDLMAAQSLTQMGKYTWDVVPMAGDLLSRGVGEVAQRSVENYYYLGQKTKWWGQDFGIKLVDGQPVIMNRKIDDKFAVHAFYYNQAKAKGADMKAYDITNPWPETKVHRLGDAISDKISNLYTVNAIGELLVPDMEISDVVLSKSLQPKSEIKEILNGEGRAASVKYPQEIMAFMGSYKFFDRVIGRIGGLGSPRGKELWTTIQKDAQALHKSDKSRIKLGTKKNWKDEDPLIQEQFLRQALHTHLNKRKYRFYPRLSRWLDKNRIEAYKNLPSADMQNFFVSSNMAIGGLAFQDIFSGTTDLSDIAYAGEYVATGVEYGQDVLNYKDTNKDPRKGMIPYFLGMFIVGLPAGAAYQSRGFQQNVMGATLRDIPAGNLIKGTAGVSARYVSQILSGQPIMAHLDLMKGMFVKQGGSYTAAQTTINNLASKIPDSVASTPKEKVKTAEGLLIMRDSLLKTGTAESAVLEIESTRAFIKNIQDFVSADPAFAEQYKQALKDLDSLLSIRALDKTVGEVTGIGFGVDIEGIMSASNYLVQARGTAQKLLLTLEQVQKFVPQGDSDAFKMLGSHVETLRKIGQSELKLADERIAEYKDLIGLHKELVTSENYTGLLDNNRNLIKLLDIEVELEKASGGDPKKIAELIQNTREKANRNVTELIRKIGQHTKDYTDETAGSAFVQLDEQYMDTVTKYGNILYREVEKKLVDKPVKLQAIYNTLKRSFFDINPAENSIRNVDAARIGDEIGEVVADQFEEMIERTFAGNIKQGREVRQEIKELAGLNSLETPQDYLKLYGMIRSKDGVELRSFIRSYMPAMADTDFLIPAKNVLDIHKILVASQRNAGQKRSTIHNAYVKGIDTLKAELNKINPAIGDEIDQVGRVYADNVHQSVSGRFANTNAHYTGRDSRVKNFARSTANPTNKVYDKLQPSEWLDQIVNDILTGKWERASTMLNDRYGMLISRSVKQKSDVPAKATDIGLEATERRIVDPQVAAQLSALINWKLNERLFFAPKTQDIIKKMQNGEYADIAMEGVGMLKSGYKGKGRKAAEVDVSDFREMLQYISSFNEAMRLPEGGVFQILDPYNLKTATFQPITKEMSATNFAAMNSQGNLNNIIRTLIKNDKNVKAQYKQYVTWAQNADKRAVRTFDAELKKVIEQKNNFTEFMDSLSVSTAGPMKKSHFNFNTAYEFLTKENGRNIKLFLDKNDNSPDAIEFVQRVLQEGFNRRTTVKLTGPEGEYTASTVVPASDGKVMLRTDYVTTPITDLVVREMERIPDILTDNKYGIFRNHTTINGNKISGEEYMARMREIYIKTHKITTENLDLKNVSWSGKAIPSLKFTDIPGQNTYAQVGANSLAFMRRQISPAWFGMVLTLKDTRVKKLNNFLTNIRNKEMAELFYLALTDQKKGQTLLRDHWTAGTGQKIAAGFTRTWVDNEINYQLENPNVLDDILPKEFINKQKSKYQNLDDVENIQKESEVLDEQINEIFNLNGGE